MIGVNKNKIGLSTILAFLVVARLACPALSNIPFMSMAFVFVYGVLFCITYFVETKIISHDDLLLLVPLLLYTIFVVARSILAGNGLFSSNAFNAYTLFFLTTIYLWLKKQPTARRANMLKLILFACLFNYVYSIIVLCFDPQASRIAAATSVLEPSPYDILHAVGSFDTVYGGIFIVVLLLYMRKAIVVGKKRTLVNLILLLAIVFIVMAAYATAIIMLALALFMVISNRNKILSGIGITTVFLIFIFHETFGSLIMELAEQIPYSETISMKVKEFGYMIKTFETAGTYSGQDGRFQKMLDSLNTFFDRPLFGGYGVQGAKIGGHSEFFDILGEYGLVGFSLIVAFFVFLYIDISRNIKEKRTQKSLRIVFFLFFILSVLNPALYALLMIPIILMIPLSESYVQHALYKDVETGSRS